jgi:hypothetical protein
MNQHVAIDAGLATELPQRKGQACLLAVGSFILVVAILAVAALVSDASLTADQRLQVFLQSGIYP